MRGWIGLALLAASGAASAQAETLPLPGWMAGCWEQVSGERWVEECWMEPRGGVMLGAGRSGEGARLRSWEATQIVREADGAIAFYASPKGAPRVRFAAISQSDSDVVFVNSAHDYPQRIRYWRDGERLMAETSLADGGEAERWSFRPVR